MNGRRDFRPDERRGRAIASPLDVVEGFLNEDLEPADNPLTGATMAAGSIIAWQQDAPEGTDLGDWDASTNDPALSDGSGTEGDFYRVSVSGSTELDGQCGWLVGQYLKTVDGAWVRSAPLFYEVDPPQSRTDWDASLNDPPLASSVGTEGDFYRVVVAGTTTLDGETDWEVDEHLQFTGGVWVRRGPRTSCGHWDANTNTPTLASSTASVEGDYFVVDVAGSTTLDGVTDWAVGEYLEFRDGVWSRRGPRSVVWLVNRDPGLSGLADSYFQAVKVNGEFRIQWLSCEPVRP